MTFAEFARESVAIGAPHSVNVSVSHWHHTTSGKVHESLEFTVAVVTTPGGVLASVTGATPEIALANLREALQPTITSIDSVVL